MKSNHIAVTLDLEKQQQFINITRDIVANAQLYRAQMPGGANFRYLQSGAGYGWTSGHGGGYRYQRTHPITGKLLPDIPNELIEFSKQFGLVPDALLINFYQDGSTLGMHQDKDEKDFKSPVVSISIGDTAVFNLGGVRRSDPVQEITLNSGSVMVLGGDTRLAWHGVKKVLTNSSPSGLVKQGRINLTLRKSQ